MDMEAEAPQGEAVPPQNENPEMVKDGVNFVTVFISQYGWYILFVMVALMFLKNKLEPKLQKLQKKREERYYTSTYDADTVAARQEAMLRVREKMQEEHDEKARLADEERKKKEEEKRKEKIEDWDRHVQGKGYRSKYRPDENAVKSEVPKTNKDKKPKATLRQNDFNPLMGGGSGSGASFRPSRRSGFGGG